MGGRGWRGQRFDLGGLLETGELIFSVGGLGLEWAME